MRTIMILIPLLTTACLQQPSGSAPAAETRLVPAPEQPTPTPAAVAPTTAAGLDAALVGTWVQVDNAANSITFSGRSVTYSSSGLTSSTHTTCRNVSTTTRICDIPTTCSWTADALTGVEAGGRLYMYMKVLSSTSYVDSSTWSTNCMYTTTAAFDSVPITFTSPTCFEAHFHMAQAPYPVYCKQ